MMFYVQYDESGNIVATVNSMSAPVHPRQLAFDEYQDTVNKRVDLNTLELVDA